MGAVEDALDLAGEGPHVEVLKQPAGTFLRLATATFAPEAPDPSIQYPDQLPMSSKLISLNSTTPFPLSIHPMRYAEPGESA